MQKVPLCIFSIALFLDFRLCSSSPSSSLGAAESVRFLLGGEDQVNTFFENHFGKESLVVKDSSRDDRRTWMETHRRFLQNENIDGLLSANASAFDPDQPLLLGRDVDILRISKEAEGFWGPARIASFFPSEENSKREEPVLKNADRALGTDQGEGTPGVDRRRVVDHSKVHEAFKDGFEIVFYNMEAKSRQVHLLSERLSSFWMVPVTASLHFMPAKTNQVDEKAPVFHASDVFIVQLDGEQHASLYPGAFEAPFLEHTLSSDIRADVVRDLDTTKAENVTIAEGDMLYVPRGYAVDMRTSRKISLYLKLSVETHACVILDGLSEAISTAEEFEAETGEENPLRSNIFDNLRAVDAQPAQRANELDSDFDVKITFGELLRVAARATAQMNPKMREYYPIGEYISAAMEEADAESAHATLLRNLDSFIEAGKQALFNPLIDFLASDATSSNVPQGIATWAKRLSAASPESLAPLRSEDTFQRCLKYIQKHRKALIEAASERLLKEHAKSEAEDLPKRMERMKRVLEKHGHLNSVSACSAGEVGTCSAQ